MYHIIQFLLKSRILNLKLGLALISMIMVAFPCYAAENGPYHTSIHQNNEGDLVFIMTEPAEFRQHAYKVLGFDVTFDRGSKKTLRFMFDESKTERAFNSNRTAIIVVKYIPASDIKRAMDLNDNKLWENYYNYPSKFTMDAVIAVSNDYGQSYSASLSKDPETGTAVAVPNENFTDAALVLSLDNQKDMVFGHGEYSRLSRLYEWEDESGFTNLYDKPLLSKQLSDYPYDDTQMEESSNQDDFEDLPSENELIETYQTWDEDEIENGIVRTEESPYFKTYNDSREYEEDGKRHAAFTDEGPYGMVIPSGEKFINGIQVDSIYGTAEIGMRGATHTWDFTYDYTYEVIKYPQGGSPYLETINGSVRIPITRRAYYLYIWNLDLYDFDGAEISSSIMPDEILTYNNQDQHLVDQEVKISNTGPVTKEELTQYLTINYGGSSLTSDRPVYEAEIYTRDDGNIKMENGSSATISSYVPEDDGHIIWADVDTTRSIENIGYMGSYFDENGKMAALETAEETARRMAWSDANLIIGNGASDKTKTMDGEEESFATVKNDYLKIGYDGEIILDGSECPVIFEDDESYRDEYDRHSLPDYLRDAIGISDFNTTETYETSPAFEKPQTRIPEEISNREYFTGIKAFYNPVLSHLDSLDIITYSESKATSRSMSGTYDAIKLSYTINEPVVIHTPVISPISIHKVEDGSDALNIFETIKDTQFTQEKADESIYLGMTGSNGLIQLKLDESYFITFDDLVHLNQQGYRDSATLDNAWEETNNKYDKYTKAKYLHFPFDVVIYRAGGVPEYVRHSEQRPVLSSEDEEDGSEVTKKDIDGGQYWIMLNPDEWESVKFYIPPWAIEDIYNEKAYGRQIECRVDAQNVVSEDEDHREDAGEPEKNEERDTYIATYTIDVELSGWMYDFEILSVNDSESFNPSNDILINSWYSFYLNGIEKKTGTKNRLGKAFVRKGIDDSVTEYWNPQNTIPLSGEKSFKYEDMGALNTGTSFMFAIKTMANLWHPQDYIKIVPTYYFVKKDRHSDVVYGPGDFLLYYNDYTSDSPLMMKSAADGNGSITDSVALSDQGFSGAISAADYEFKCMDPEVEAFEYSGNDYVNFKNGGISVEELNREISALKTKKQSIPAFGEIRLGDGLKLYQGSEKLLSCNLDRNISNLIPLNSVIPIPIEDTDIHTNDSADSERERESNLLKICMQQWFGKYTIPDELFVSLHTEDEIENYVKIHGKLDTADPDLFEQEGYLILNFDIIAVKNGKEYLQFKGNGANLNMWQTQGQDVDINIPNATILTDSGDVAVIDISRSLSDLYSSNFLILH